MFKKLTIASIALIASSGIAWADATDTSSSSTETTTSTTVGDTGSSSATDTSSAPTQSVHKHKKHHKKHPHKKHHHKTTHSYQNSAPTTSTETAPSGDYKGEVSAVPVNAPCTPTSCLHSPYTTGPYVGLGVGSRVNYTSRPSVFNGLDGTVFGGYSAMWDQLFGAVEIFVQDSASLSNSPGINGSVSSNWGYGLSLLPGYMINDSVLGYLRFGVVNTRFSSGNNNETGGQVGLGLQTALNNCWDLRGEYIYSFYNSLPGNAGNPKSQVFNLGLIYKFQF